MGLDYAHQRQLVHGDVSTANLILDRSGTANFIDFGLAAPVGEAGVSGTPAYMSPEAAAGQPLLPARSTCIRRRPSSLNSLPVVRSFLARVPVSVVRTHVDEAAPALEEHRPQLRDLLGRALDKDPSRRPGDAGAFLGELQERSRRALRGVLALEGIRSRFACERCRDRQRRRSDDGCREFERLPQRSAVKQLPRPRRLTLAWRNRRWARPDRRVGSGARTRSECSSGRDRCGRRGRRQRADHNNHSCGQCSWQVEAVTAGRAPGFVTPGQVRSQRDIRLGSECEAKSDDQQGRALEHQHHRDLQRQLLQRGAGGRPLEASLHLRRDVLHIQRVTNMSTRVACPDVKTHKSVPGSSCAAARETRLETQSDETHAGHD